MSKQTLKRLESYKKIHNLSDFALSQKLCGAEGVKVYPVYIYRWRKAGRIIGIYEKYVKDFLKEEKDNGRF